MIVFFPGFDELRAKVITCFWLQYLSVGNIEKGPGFRLYSSSGEVMIARIMIEKFSNDCRK